MVYDEYKKIINRYVISSSSGGSVKLHKKSVALKSFEYLLLIELIGHPGSQNSSSGIDYVTDSAIDFGNKKTRNQGLGNGMKEFTMLKLLLDPNQIVQAAEIRQDLPAVVRRWVCQ
ncbi:Origin recognition complex subunit 4 [Smittium mucronatum]|uniref:Origin recognition complex subunit 4 n=1 Tax=Smittium mucronatum TaxID=133383 RepID=A0A1R0GW39_9FUNG|nr:Origin recognition complex subunit 4 [Smittium mucronatum]